MKLDEMLWSLTTPYPHTELWEWAHQHAATIGDYRTTSFFKAPRAVIETPEYPAAQRLRMFYTGNLRGNSYSCFFPKQIHLSHFIRFLYYIARYDAFHLPQHITRILFGRYHRRHIKEFFKRVFS